MDVNGKVVLENNLGVAQEGLNYSKVRAADLPPGDYLLLLSNGVTIFKRTVVKAN